MKDSSKFKKNRVNDTEVSIFHSDYTLFNEINLFISKVSLNKKWNKILDFGAGNSPYKNHFDYNEYIAVDVEQNSKGTVDYIINNGDFLPFPDGSFDLILCMDVLEHIHNIQFILNELYRVLENDGEVVISLPFLYREHEMPFDFQRVTSVGIQKHLKNAGFNNIDIKKSGNSFFTIYSLWNESKILNGEHISMNFFNKIVRRVVKYIFLPFLNVFIFNRRPKIDDGVYHHILIRCSK